MMQGSLAEKLRVMRARKGLTLTEASEQIGITRHTLRSLELGGQDPHYPTLAKIAKGYGVPVEELLEEEAVPLGGAPSGERPPRSLAEWLEERCGHAYLALSKEEIERLFDDLVGTGDEERRARELGLQIHEEQRVFNAFPSNVSPEERMRMRKTIRDSISKVAVNYGVALFESGLHSEYAEDLGHFVDLQRTLDEATA